MGIMWVFEIISGITSDVHESTWLVFTIYYYSKLTLDFYTHIKSLQHRMIVLINLFQRYVTDMLNMLQPIYIFIIFVLKKNVMNTMLGRDKKKTITTKTKSRKTARTLLKNTSTGTLTMKSDVVETIELTPIIKM